MFFWTFWSYIFKASLHYLIAISTEVEDINASSTPV